MGPVIPRWEWRVFGRRFPAAEADFAARTPTGVQDSDELYLLARSGDNVKIRDELMDIKELQEVDEHGLQRWSPILKASFPLSPADAMVVHEALGLPARPATTEPLALDTLLRVHAAPAGPIRAVPVHKHRVRYSVGGCLAEVADIEVGGRSVRTVAVEGEDPGAVLTTVRSMGLGGYRNTSYPLGLAETVDASVRRSAIIDVGTNSIKLCVGEPTPDGRWRFLADRAEVTRLGEGLATSGTITDAAVERTVTVIEGMVTEAHRLGAVAVEALGTAGLRAAANAASVIARIAARTGARIEVISGEEESRLAYRGVAADLDTGTGGLVVFDTGGGSSQFTFGHGDRVDDRFSLPVGAVRFTERFGLDQAVPPERLREARAAIAAELEAVRDHPKPDVLVGIGGAVTNLVAVQLALEPYDPDVVRGTRLEAAEVERQIERYRGQDSGRAPDHRRSPVRTRRGDPRGCLHRRGRHGGPGADLARRERSGPPAWSARRALRRGPIHGRVRPGPEEVRVMTTGTGSGGRATAEGSTRLSDADTARVLELLKGADTVELKTSVPMPAQRAAIAGLPLDPVEAQPRQVFFFDTHDLVLDRAGVVVRARRIQGGRGDTVVKLRPVEPATLSADLRRSAGFGVELDALPGGFVCSASLRGRATGQEIRDVADGSVPLRKVFSKEQRALYAAHAPEGITLDDLVVLGPTFVLKSVFQTALVDRSGAPQRRLVAEVWLFPDGARILELSLKCLPSEAFQVAAEARAWLASRGVDITGEQQPKTRTALAYFSALETRAGSAT